MLGDSNKARGAEWTAIKKNKITPFAATRMGLEIIILGKVSQTERNIMISLVCRDLKRNDTDELTYKTETETYFSHRLRELTIG